MIPCGKAHAMARPDGHLRFLVVMTTGMPPRAFFADSEFTAMTFDPYDLMSSLTLGVGTMALTTPELLLPPQLAPRMGFPP